MTTFKNLNKKIVLSKLLKYGLFPQTLNGLLSSKDFGVFMIKHRGTFKKAESFSVCPYKLTKNNNAPRYLSIPHPLAYYKLCKCISDNWERIDAKIGEAKDYSNRSLIIPKFNNRNNRLVSMLSYDKNKNGQLLQLKNQIGSKYFVHADISACFSSIYTHSISWALIGKEKAKKHFLSGKWGNDGWANDLDKRTSLVKNKETNGLPIGPDSSNILSEIILSQIDKKLMKYKYLRFIDDFKCFCSSKEEADNFIKDLSIELEKYQLQLNTSKTKIKKLPLALTDDFVSQLRNFELPDLISHKNVNRVLDFLDLSVRLSEKRKEYSPFKYAIKTIKRKMYKNYEEFEKIILYVLNIIFLHPYTIDVCSVFIKYGFNSFGNKKNDFKNILNIFFNKLLNEHAKYGRSDVIVYSLFLINKYNLDLPSYTELKKVIFKLNDPLATLFLFLYAKNRGCRLDEYYKLANNVDQKEWWIYIYQLYYFDNTGNKIKNLMYKDFYKTMKNQKISFIKNP